MRIHTIFILVIFLLIFFFPLASPCLGEDIGISDNFTSNDTEFLFMMNQYWIPDLYEIKGRVDSTVSYDVSDMLNLSVEYANIRLKKNLNETVSYNVSQDLANLRTAYNRTVVSELGSLNRLPALNRSDPQY